MAVGEPEAPYLELLDVSKHFGGVQALDSVSLGVRRGSIHALVGENGAGKSTLGKIVAGALSAGRRPMFCSKGSRSRSGRRARRSSARWRQSPRSRTSSPS